MYYNMSANPYSTRSLKVSADKKYLLIKRTSHKVFRRSSYGSYSILPLRTNGRHLGKSFALRPSIFHPSNEDENEFRIRYVKWAPTGSGLVYVDYNNNIFYRKDALAKYVPSFLDCFTLIILCSACFVFLVSIILFLIFANRDVQLTTTGVADQVYNGIPDWVFEEEVFEDNHAIWWSPDSSKLVCYRE